MYFPTFVELNVYPATMSFSVQIRNYLAFFMLLGLWSSWQNSKYKLFLRISLAISNICFCALFSLTVLIDRFRDFDALSNIVSNVLFILLSLTHLVILLESILKNEAQAKLIDTLSEVDHLFFVKIGLSVSHRSEKFGMLIRLLGLASTEVVVKWAIVITLLLSTSDKRYVFFTLYSNFVICLRLIQILLFVYLLRNRLTILNSELVDIVNANCSHGYVQQITNYKNKNNTIPFLRNVFAKRSTYDRLISLKQIYGKLFEICEQISDAFGWSLLLIVIFIFATVTFEFYWAYISLGNALTVLVCILFSVPILVTLGTLVYYCSSCCQQVCVILSTKL